MNNSKLSPCHSPGCLAPARIHQTMFDNCHGVTWLLTRLLICSGLMCDRAASTRKPLQLRVVSNPAPDQLRLQPAVKQADMSDVCWTILTHTATKMMKANMPFGGLTAHLSRSKLNSRFSRDQESLHQLVVCLDCFHLQVIAGTRQLDVKRCHIALSPHGGISPSTWAAFSPLTAH